MNFELLLLSNLLFNEVFLKKVLPHIKPEYFLDSCEREVFKLIHDFTYKYKNAPTKEALAVTVADNVASEGMFNGVVSVMEKLQPDVSNIEWLLDKTEGWAQEKAVYNAIMKSIAITDGTDKTLDKNAIPSLLTQALAVSFKSYVGHSYFDQAEEQYDYYHSDLTKFAFDIDILNKVTKGGVPNKTLNIVQAGINVGKTTFLIHQACHWLLKGKNVAVFTMEVAENVYRERIDCCIMDLTFDQVHALEKTQYLGRVNKVRQKTMGELYIKEFPAGGAHVGHFRHALEEMRIKKGFVPDVIIIDYLTICASSTLPASAKGNTNTYFTAVAEEMRGFAKENDCPVWTAAQFDRGGQTSTDVTMGNVGLALGIAATADFMVVFMQPDELASQNQAIGKILKNRYANKSMFKNFIIGIDNDKQKFYDVDSRIQSNVMTKEEQTVYESITKPAIGQGSDPASWNFG